jgi:hypothetical protein
VTLTIIFKVRLDIKGVENVAGLCEPTLADIIVVYPPPIFLHNASRIHTNLIINRRPREWESAPNPPIFQN